MAAGSTAVELKDEVETTGGGCGGMADDGTVAGAVTIVARADDVDDGAEDAEANDPPADIEGGGFFTV